jgi:hypothetical protein
MSRLAYRKWKRNMFDVPIGGLPGHSLRRHAPFKRLASTDAPEEDFGNYQIILPQEPYIWGTSHIVPRPVPPHIQKPLYAGPAASG